MLFITNRRKIPANNNEIIHKDAFKKYRFDLKKESPLIDLYYCHRDSKNNYKDIGSGAFLNTLKQSNAKEVLFFIHGSGSLPENTIFPMALKLQELFEKKEKNLVDVVCLIWPTTSGIRRVKNYWDDQKAADASGLSFARLVNRFLDWRYSNNDDQCFKRINILAHSMGNRVLREMLINVKKYDLPQGLPLMFKNIFMVAADVVNETLSKNHKGSIIAETAKNVIVYHADGDHALGASKIANLKNRIASRRLGHTGTESGLGLEIARNIKNICCDKFNDLYDNPLGHTYFLQDEKGKSGHVFNHIFSCIKKGNPMDFFENE